MNDNDTYIIILQDAENETDNIKESYTVLRGRVTILLKTSLKYGQRNLVSSDK